ncbi:unnamed protein product [Effrenium voratum]|uniref:Uncharacterized protein n=1 Tax=Effrenium voratum TaxID=2562239 RepID=A0AA36IRD6_9DINO|nr:unnamed protein product [Effrenium voratum]
MASSRLLPCLVLLALLGSLSFCSPAAPAARARSFGLTGPRLEHTPRPLPPVRAGAEAEKPEEGSIGGALLSLLGGVAFWAVLYWIFFKATDHLTNIVQGSPRLEVLSFAILGFLPLVLVQTLGLHGW